jgi:glutamate synthase (NADPH/NADH) small chain
MNANASGSGQAKFAWSEIPRTEPPKRSVPERLGDFHEIDIPYDEDTVRAQASRCIQCPNANCITACPLGTPIVDLMALTADGQFKEASEMLFASCSLPEVSSHICIGGRICETVCVLAGRSDPIPVRSIARFLLNYGWKHGLAEPPLSPPKGKRVAVLGSGICGLVAADMLSRLGYALTVMDSRQLPGGRVINGLPGFRVDKVMVNRRLELLRQRGVQFRMGLVWGEQVKLSELRREFDAVFLGFGQADAVPLEVPGADLNGVYPADLFVPQPEGGGVETSPVDLHGRRVVVLGGGDTAMDALRVALRRGASAAVCIYRRDQRSMPADAEEYANAREEGAHFIFLSQPVALIGNAAREVTHVRCVRMEAGKPDWAGRLAVKPIPGSEFDVPAEVVPVAYGYTAARLPRANGFGDLAVSERGLLLVDANQMTNLPGVFAGGSIVHGSGPLAQTVRDARTAAAAIDSYLAARSSSDNIRSV